MNWLAHLRLSPDEPQVRLGALLGDFARADDVERLPPRVRDGVLHHRALDRFTDAHPVFRRSRARLSAPVRRFVGVLVDVFYDHFLARDWHRFGDGGPLRAFTAAQYALLDRHRALLPAALRSVAPAMQREDWLASYAELAGIDLVLARMSQRLRRENPLASGGGELRAHYAELEGDFAEFFADAERFAGPCARIT
jgi:acyl carrier protein phosphodiesterase